MNVKIQSGGKNQGVQANTGSCSNYLKYLEHEDAGRIADGKEVLPFFNSSGTPVSKEDVLDAIDGNHSGLHRSDAKFYALTFSPSDDEIDAMGSTEEEMMESGRHYVEKAMDEYAANFHNPNIRDHNDILFFYKFHWSRTVEDKHEFHIQGVVSRKDASGHYKLSPMTNHRNTSSGPVKGGFDREEYARRCETLFDGMFSYKRAVKDSFDYCNAIKNGTYPEIVEQQGLVAMEEKPELARQKVEFLQKKLNDIRSAKVNRFWNEYHSKYKQMLDELMDDIERIERLYETLAIPHGQNVSKIKEKFEEMQGLKDQMVEAKAELSRASTAQQLIILFTMFLSALDPGVVISLGCLSFIYATAAHLDAADRTWAIYDEMSSVHKSIKELKRVQDHYAPTMKKYLRNRYDLGQKREEVKAEINNQARLLEMARPSGPHIIWQDGVISWTPIKITEENGVYSFWKLRATEYNGKRSSRWDMIEQYADLELIGNDATRFFFRVRDFDGNVKIVNQYDYEVKGIGKGRKV